MATVELVDWVYDVNSRIYYNRWEKKVTLTARHIAFFKATTLEEINNALNTVAIGLRKKGKI